MTGDAPSVAIVGTRGYPSYYGGLETAVRYLAPYLADRGWQVTVHGHGAHASAPPNADPVDPRVHVTRVWSVDNKAASKLSAGLSSAALLAARPVDVALVMSTAMGFWLPALRVRGIPSVVNVDGIEWERAKWGKLARTVLYAGAKTTAWFADDLIFDARAIEAYWAKEFKRSGNFIPYGGAPQHNAPLPEGLADGSYVLMVARLVPENTVGEFLDAVPAIAEKYPVVIVGTTGFGGEFDRRCERLARTYDRVTWLGHVSDDRKLNALYAHAGVYFHGHSVGGTNPSLVQAMAAGAPIIARDTIYAREVLADAGRLCAPTAQAITTAICDLMDDDAAREQLSQAAQGRASTHYTWDKVCADYEAALRKAMAK